MDKLFHTASVDNVYSECFNVTFTTLKQHVPVIPVTSAPDDTDKRPYDVAGYEVGFLVDLTGTVSAV